MGATSKDSKKSVSKDVKKSSKKEESSSESSGSESSGSESSDSEEVEEKKEESSDSEASGSDSEDKSAKRSAEESEEAEESSKKQKVEESAEVAAEPTSEPGTIFVGRLSWNIDDEWLGREFEHIGEIVGSRVILERDSGKSRGYGYVDFKNMADAEKAVAEMNGKEIDGRPINVDISTTKPQSSGDRSNARASRFGDVPSTPSDTLFVGNLSFNAERDQLFDLFSQYGSVISVRLPTHPDTEQPKGFGYVQFGSLDESKAAFEACQGTEVAGRSIRLDFSTPRDPSTQGSRGGFGGDRGGRGGSREVASVAVVAPEVASVVTVVDVVALPPVAVVVSLISRERRLLFK
ncbi:RNA-binding domain-containing protein [Nadsonia fulvescens var. elongata DSM 6958]|uniref:RNA-binding domain-containing protein n=1 Tax=Nadsonia fulvescens var. elongata DSM 6958 TaxID=857566 RepID=A0A1E3PP86_9ASCO|nr:RNA-binding domain-containing protein [Nadsonia fulvescens var. elongata DSM 6958]